MIGSDIAKRYAKAFFQIAAEEKMYEKYYGEIKSFATAIEDNENLREFLSNPVFDQDDKKVVLENILTKMDLSPVTENFLHLLADKRRVVILPEIVSGYRELMDDVLKKVRVNVKTAFPLTAELSDKLQKGLEDLTGKQVEMTVVEESFLLGGIVVSVGDTLYDGSIRIQLNNISNLLGKEI